MTARSLRRASLMAAMVMAVFTTLPGVSQAAESVTCLNAWGETHPRAWCEDGFRGTLTPIDQPAGRGLKGVLYVRGITAVPAQPVTVIVTDGVSSVLASTTSSAVSDPEAGKPAGAFNAELKVSNLGTHRAKAGALPSSLDPDDRGKTTLTVLAFVGDITTAMSTLVDKYAATYKDTFAPSLIGPARGDRNDETFFGPDDTQPRFPPTYWCHTASPTLFFDPENVCSERDGTRNDCPLAIPGVLTINAPCSTGQALVSGIAVDDGGGAFGIGSEIADIRIKITQGSTVLSEFSQVNRRESAQAWWTYTAQIDDYEPNWPETCFPDMGIEDACYEFSVTVTDAWGHTSTATSGPVAVTPF